MIKPIETSFDGYRFRSRTEARWAVFFKEAGIRFKYEPEGFEMRDGVRYLPDFWLIDAKLWFEVKGDEPNERETTLCQMLAKESGFDVLLAVGAPDIEAENIIGFRSSSVAWPDGEPDIFDGEKFQFLADRRNNGEFWLGNKNGVATKIISVDGSQEHDRFPTTYQLEKSYNAAKSARFEFGESGA